MHVYTVPGQCSSLPSDRSNEMMTLSDSSDLVTPILKSKLFETNEELQKKADEIRELFVGFKRRHPTKLNQFEILDEEKENAFREFIALYEELLEQQHEPT